MIRCPKCGSADVAQHRLVMQQETSPTDGVIVVGISYYCRACREEWADFGRRMERSPLVA